MQSQDYSQYRQLLSMHNQDTFNKYILESKSLLETVSHYLKGEEQKEVLKQIDGRTVYVPEWHNSEEVSPPINQAGYKYTINLLNALLDKIASSGNITEEKASLLTAINMNTLAINYVLNYEEFGFRSISQMDSLIDTILTLVFMQFSKSVNLELLKQMLTTTSVQELRTLNNDKKKQVEPSLTI